MQTFSLEREPGSVASRARVETRVLLRQQGEWAGYSYRWNAEQTDAPLVPKEGTTAQFSVSGAQSAGTRMQDWRFPSRAECMMCHSRAASFVLGVSEAQMNRDHDYGAVRDNQLRARRTSASSPAPCPSRRPNWPSVVDPYELNADLEARARAYLNVNCSVCHVSAGGGNSQMELGSATPRDDMKLLAARPQHDTFGISDAMLVAPGEPDRSVLLHRLTRRGKGQMPPLVSTRVDERAVSLMRDWIASLPPEKTIVRQWTMDDLAGELEQVTAGRSFESGQTAFRKTGCVQCHRLAGEGGSVGPDLSAAQKKSALELLESILSPSKVIADEYAAYAIETDDGQVISGRIEREDSDVIVVRPNSALEAMAEIKKDTIVGRKRLAISNMPEGIVNVLEHEQVLDLLAYLLAGGNPPAGKSP